MKTIALWKAVRLGLATLLVTTSCFAENAPANDEAEAQKQSSQEADQNNNSKTTSKPATKRAKNDKDNGGIFRPSEEISEDFAVSFPVDI